MQSPAAIAGKICASVRNYRISNTMGGYVGDGNGAHRSIRAVGIAVILNLVFTATAGKLIHG
jgi:hypothetical protein